MKIGDIKIEALRLMFAQLDPLISAENLSSYENSDTIGDYLFGMTGSINRALVDITSRKILPEKAKDLTFDGGSSLMSAHRIDLSAVEGLKDDFYAVSRLVVESEYGYDGNAPYRMEGNTIVFICPYPNARVTLLYYPKIKLLTGQAYIDNVRDLSKIPDENPDENPVVIPDEIAAVIPYFIKGELYREDEIGDAAEAMSWYEQRLASLAPYGTERQGNVRSTYSMVTL